MNGTIKDSGRTLAALLATAALLCACDGVRDGGAAISEVSFTVSVPGTRSAVTPHEADVERLDVLLFRALDGGLDASGQSEGGRTVTAGVTPGVPLRWYVVANAPAGLLPSFSTEEAFLSAVTTLAHSTASSLVMRSAGILTAGASPDSVPAPLDRYCCKVSVGTIAVKWMDAFSTPPAVTLERIALVNVVGSTPWSGTPEAGSLWYNRGEIDPSPGPLERDMLVAEYGSLGIPDSRPMTLDCALYCMPNPTDNGLNSSNSPSWSPRNTRVAVELKVDGQSNWYPVDLPAMECNRHYVIDGMTINGPGSQGPDYPVTRSGLSFSVSVSPWGEESVGAQF